ncbi:MAG TPA: transglutaminase domain-containing protein [Candidatus Brocadiia bacterium]|nr:transglutaminase domain-containing protein [Candidatus Brocadiia bacterium]
MHENENIAGRLGRRQRISGRFSAWGLSLLPLLLLGLSSCAAPVAGKVEPIRAAESPAKPNLDRAGFVAWARIINTGETAFRKAEVRLALPRSGVGQEIGEILYPSGAPDRVVTDRFGNRIAFWGVRGLAPRASFGRCYATDVGLYPREYKLAARDSVKTLPDDERALYLADGEWYRMSDPRIAEFLRQIAPSGDDIAKAKAISKFVSDRIKYVRDSRWDAAPAVMERGTGSCSEYSFSFIALARSAGIPARYSGGYRVRSPGNLYLDTIAHRWPEVWLEDIGWVALDPTADRGKKEPLTHFGRLPGNLVQAYTGDVSELIGNDYRGSGWAEKGEKFADENRGFFVRNADAAILSDGLLQLLKSIEAGTFDADSAKSLTKDVPFAFPALEPMLFSGNDAAASRAVELCEEYSEPSLIRLLENFVEHGPAGPARIAAAGVIARMNLKKK